MPHAVTNVPAELNFWTRLESLATTYVFPEESIATPLALPVRNWPLPMPRVPNFDRKVPVELNFWTLLLPESVT